MKPRVRRVFSAALLAAVGSFGVTLLLGARPAFAGFVAVTAGVVALGVAAVVVAVTDERAARKNGATR